MDDDTLFRVLFLALWVFLTGTLGVWGALARRRQEPSERYTLRQRVGIVRRREGRAALLLESFAMPYWAAAMVLDAWAPPWFSGLALPVPSWARWAAVVPAAGGLALVVWARSLLGRQWASVPRLQREHRLVTDGPYRHVRHPMYTGDFAFISFSAVVAANAFVVSAMVAALAMMALRIPAEENMLLERFGDGYRDYMRRTPRLFPRLRPRPP